MPLIIGIAIAILGRYRGLRLTEIGRFAPIWLERRRVARAKGIDGEDEEIELTLENTVFAAREDLARERAPPLEGMWVINSAEDLEPSKRRQVPQARPDSEAQFAPRIGASGRPLKHNAWIIKDSEDV